MLIQGAITVAAGASLTTQGSTFTNTLAVSGTMEAHDSSFSDTLTVSGTASLTGCTLAASATIDLGGGGSLSLASTVVAAAALGAAEGTLSGVGSTLQLDAVTVPDLPHLGEVTSTTIVAADGSKAIDLGGDGAFFLVLSGPCAVSEGGRCVGRAEGYGGDEDCAITVGGGGGVLGPCPVFDTRNGDDPVTLPGGAAHYRSDCPEGAALAPGDGIAWHSDCCDQGSVGYGGQADYNGCAAKGTCGLPYSHDGLGGGWELCF
eukprot:COSAG04_NODE_3405_length_2844_cov_3.814208_2_plen_261_part_00